MPSGNRRGPLGQGPVTGRGLGLCNGYQMPGNITNGFGGGRGTGRGRGFRRNNRFGMQESVYGPGRQVAGLSGEGEKETLKEQAAYLGKELEQIKKRLEELEKEGI